MAVFRMTAERLRDGQTLRITQNEERWQLLEVDGLSSPEAQISDYDVASLDGVRVNHIKMEAREITITLAIHGNGTYRVEDNRQALYNLFRIKDVIRLHIQTRNRNVYIDGYVRQPQCNNFSNLLTMDITMLCPSPFFNDASTIEENTSKREELFEFPIYPEEGYDESVAYTDYTEADGFYTNIGEPVEFSTFNPERSAVIVSDSENDTGITIVCTFRVSASKITINNEDTLEYFTVVYDFQIGDILTICTISGEKTLTLLRNGITYNMIPYLDTGSSWFQLQSGNNSFNYIVDDDITIANVEMELYYIPIYFAI